MDNAPWLTILGWGEDGPDGLTATSAKILQDAEIIAGSTRHLDLLQPGCNAARFCWPVPFAAGLEPFLALRGKKVVLLASGDPFWFGAGTSITQHLQPEEWRALPGLSSFSLAAAALGWPLESTECLGLHAAPLERLRPHLGLHKRLLITLKDGAMAQKVAQYLCSVGFDRSELTVFERLGGLHQKIRSTRADGFNLENIEHPALLAIVPSDGPALPLANGWPDSAFSHDGQITKRPVRALTLSALCPKPGDVLWDLGGGSGSISLEWLASDTTLTAFCIEQNPDRVSRIKKNARELGLDRLQVIQAQAPEKLHDLPLPNAVFIGGGIGDALLHTLWHILPAGTRLVCNGVTLEAEALLINWQLEKGGELLRIELSQMAPLGSKRGWKANFPILQWSCTL